MFQSVLFPTDFSPFNERLAQCLPDLKHLGAEEIVLLNVVELGPQIGFASDTFEQMLAWKHDAEPRLIALREKIDASGIRCRWRLELGKPALEIVRVAVEERVALIAMGAHGHGFLRGALLGSVSHEVVRYAPVPVLVLKVAVVDNLGSTECGFLCQHILRRVLLPTDFSECATEALALVKQLRTAGVSEVVVLHVREKRKRNEPNSTDAIQDRIQRIRKELEFFGFAVTILIVDGNPAAMIDRVAREQDVSLIVIGSHGRSATEDVLLGSVSDDVICRHARTVLVVRPVHAITLV
jgi:nucleotide-binding universal stress UspA family protein